MAFILKRRAGFAPDSLLAGAVRHMRAKRGISRRALARAAGVRARDLIRLERGYGAHDDLLEQLGTALGESRATLMLQVANQEYVARRGGERKLRDAVAASLGANADSFMADSRISRLPLN